uniref:Uncharacterized protein n=1 Tax=Knipowitschia caucasica TaxID=637954 RepID=A0AAV2LK48_KNICA
MLKRALLLGLCSSESQQEVPAGVQSLCSHEESAGYSDPPQTRQKTVSHTRDPPDHHTRPPPTQPKTTPQPTTRTSCTPHQPSNSGRSRRRPTQRSGPSPGAVQAQEPQLHSLRPKSRHTPPNRTGPKPIQDPGSLHSRATQLRASGHAHQQLTRPAAGPPTPNHHLRQPQPPQLSPPPNTKREPDPAHAHLHQQPQPIQRDPARPDTPSDTAPNTTRRSTRNPRTPKTETVYASKPNRADARDMTARAL